MTDSTSSAPLPEKKSRDTLLLIEKGAFYGLFVAALLGGLLFGYILSEVRGGNTVHTLAQYRPSTPTILYDVNGEVISELFVQKQKLVRFNQIPPHLINAFLSVEDQNFYNHFGIDFLAIVRAMWVNLINFGIVQGGSTLTQQVAKVVTEKTKKTLVRKFYEAILALQIEKQYSKQEILELYFNIIYLGHGTRGVAAASKLYFQKEVPELTLAESAVLARLPKAPVNYSPFRNPHKAMKAHQVVLALMRNSGFISREKAERIHKAFWKVYWGEIAMRSPSETTFGEREDKAPYYTEYVREMLLRNKHVGEDRLYSGGLKVYTTLDLDVQRAAQKHIREQLVESDRIAQGQARYYVKGADPELLSAYRALNRLVALPEIDRKEADFSQKYIDHVKKEMLKELQILTLTTGSNNTQAALMEFDSATQIYKENLHVQAAFVAVDHRTGYIQGMIGGREFSAKNQFNRALLARRQPGSSFKPFVYGAFINSGLAHSGLSMLNTPTMEMNDSGVSWAVENYEGGFTGRVTLEYGLYQSLNIVAVRVYNTIGPEAIIDFASKLLKIRDPARFIPAPTLALGASEVTPMEMATAYSIYANGGRDVIPFAIRYVTDSQGNILMNRERDIRNVLALKEKNGTIQVIPEDTAYVMNYMLRKVVDSGTGRWGIRTEAGYKGDAAGKTGTTSGWYDAWFTGYTPEMTGVVWLGFDRRTISLGRHQAGGTVASPVWGRIMKEVYEKRGYKKFELEEPDEVRKTSVCKVTGLYMSPKCKQALTGFYVKRKGKNLIPSEVCDGEHKKAIKFESLLQQKYEITNEEINKKSGFKD